MGISGVGTNPYNYYGMQYPKNNQAKSCGTSNNTANSTSNVASTNHVIYGDSDEYGKVLGAIGFPDGSSSSVYKSNNYTMDNEKDVAGITRYYNGKEVNYEEDMLHDRKTYDAEAANERTFI